MKFNTGQKVIKISIFDYPRAKKIKEDLRTASKLITEYHAWFEMQPETKWITDMKPICAIMEYKTVGRVKEKFIFNGNFNESKFREILEQFRFALRIY